MFSEEERLYLMKVMTAKKKLYVQKLSKLNSKRDKYKYRECMANIKLVERIREKVKNGKSETLL